MVERAHRDTDRHWTLVAQEAGALYALALFGHAGYEKDAIEAYRNALQGREDESFTEKLVNRLDRLENR